jgi:hypothetical protein
MARNKDRARRDMAGVGPEPGRRGLVPLHHLKDFNIADGEPDIRGWDVRTLSGREIGSVEELLVDPDRGEVVMLDVDLRGEGGHAEVPIRAVQLDRDRKVVIVDSGDIQGDAVREVRSREPIDRGEAVDRDRYDERDRHDADPDRVHDHADHVSSQPAERRTVRYNDAGTGRTTDGTTRVGDGVEEEVIERRPVIEEVVVRRRTVEE